jgi:FMN-dependent NADH-azoreductase
MNLNNAIKLLRIDASARESTRSLSRDLANQFQQQWKEARSCDEWMTCDVGMDPPPFISQDFIAAAFTETTDRTEEQNAILQPSDNLIAQLKEADIVVMSTPMYNYGIPAALKAWFDMVIRVNETFTFDLARGDRPLEPVQTGKVLVLLTSSGEFGFYPGGFNEGSNHMVPHIKTMSKYLGVSIVHHVGIEYQEFRDDRHDESKANARAAVSALVANLMEGKN